MSFILLTVHVSEELSDVLKALLSETGFDAFLDHDTGFEASIEKDLYEQQAVEQVISPFTTANQITWTAKEVAKQNWNKLWESNFHPIEISKDCYIRAAFHPPMPGYTHQLVITPKMSFGTGHHATTSLMIQHQLMIDHKGKSLIDIGCGTGVLAIMGGKLGASSLIGCDIEDWSVENALENAEMNAISMEVFEGTVEQIEGENLYDIVLANINLNVHKKSMASYIKILKPNGHLVLSGFYESDIPTVQALADQLGVQLFSTKVQDKWVSLVYTK